MMNPTTPAPSGNLLAVQPEQVSIAVEGWNANDLESRELFERSLRSLLAQTFPIRRCEVLIVIDASLDPSNDAWFHGLVPHAQILRLPDSTYFLSKNLMIDSAHRDYLVFADSDVVYEPQWLASMLGAIRPGVALVTGNTQYQPGFLSRTLSLCDWSAVHTSSGFCDWFQGNNMLMTRPLFETIRFRGDIGRSGGGSVNVLRVELARRGIWPWFCLDARAWHDLPPFWQKRIRIGGYSVRYRQLAAATPSAWMARVPVLGPFLITGGTLLKSWGRAWRLRRTLPGRGLSLPIYFVTIAAVKVVELIGAVMVAWAPGWVDRHYGWFTVPSSASSAA